MLFEVGIIPGVNKQLAKGFPLPSSSDVKFVNPKVDWAKDFLIIATDVEYIPKKEKHKIIIQ